MRYAQLSHRIDRTHLATLNRRHDLAPVFRQGCRRTTGRICRGTVRDFPICSAASAQCVQIRPRGSCRMNSVTRSRHISSAGTQTNTRIHGGRRLATGSASNGSTKSPISMAGQTITATATEPISLRPILKTCASPRPSAETTIPLGFAISH